MIKVDTIYGNDDSNDPSKFPFKTLTHAIDTSKSGDIITLQPATYEEFQIFSRKNIFELSIIGSGYNSICTSSIFGGYFDVNYTDLKIESFKISSSSSKFRFKNSRFVALNVMELNNYDTNANDDFKVNVTFENCIFDHNFQIIILGGNYTLTFKSCEISGKIPLIYAKRGDVYVKISNTDFEHTLMKVDKATASIQHISCNFPPDIPIYIGNECLIKNRDSVGNQTPLPNYMGRIRSDSSILCGEGKGTEITNDSESYERQLYGAISILSDECDELIAHRYTKLIHVKGNKPLTILLPENTDNGHIITIVSELQKIKIDNVVYKESLIVVGWIYDYGWICINKK